MGGGWVVAWLLGCWVGWWDGWWVGGGLVAWFLGGLVRWVVGGWWIGCLVVGWVGGMGVGRREQLVDWHFLALLSKRSSRLHSHAVFALQRSCQVGMVFPTDIS